MPNTCRLGPAVTPKMVVVSVVINGWEPLAIVFKSSILDVAAVLEQLLKSSWGEDLKKALLQILQKAVDLHRILYILHWTLHEVISHSPPSVACIVEDCAFSLSSEVRFLEPIFWSKLSEHIKCDVVFVTIGSSFV